MNVIFCVRILHNCCLLVIISLYLPVDEFSTVLCFCAYVFHSLVFLLVVLLNLICILRILMGYNDDDDEDSS